MTITITVYKLINYYTQRFSFPRRGWKYFHRWLKWFRVNKKEYRKKLTNGTYILVTPSEHIQQQLFWYGYYEKPVALLLENLTRANSIVLDIGANIGYFTLIAARKAEYGKVFSFEPVKESFEKLQKNIAENNLQQAKAIHVAVGETEKDSVIYVSANDNTGMSSLRPPENFSGISQSIKMISIDHWVKQSGIENIDIIKIDIEGSEFFALTGMKETLMNFKPVLIVELNADTLAYFSLSSNDVINYMNSIGYRFFAITKNGFLQEPVIFSRQENIAFIHHERVKEFNSYIL